MILGYARVSTFDQAKEDKSSLEHQESIIYQYAMFAGVDKFNVQIYRDAGVSGSTRMRTRPGGSKLFEDARPGDIVVAAKMDRIFRSSIDALQTIETLKEKDVDLVLFDMGTSSVMRDGPAKLFFSMLAAFAEFERGRIVERITTGKAQKMKKGGFVGGEAPYGLRVVGEGRASMLEVNPEEQAVIDLVKAKAHSPFFSNVVMTRELNAQGLRNRVGKPFAAYQVQRIAERLRAQ